MATLSNAKQTLRNAVAAIERYDKYCEEYPANWDKDKARLLQARLESATAVVTQEERSNEFEAQRQHEAGGKSAVQLAEGLKDLNLDLDGIKTIVAEHKSLTQQVKELSTSLYSLRNANDSATQKAKDTADAFDVVVAFMLKCDLEARMNLGMRIVLALGMQRASQFLEALKLSTWTSIGLKSVGEMVQFLGEHPDPKGEMAERAGYCVHRLRLEHNADVAKLVSDYVRDRDAAKETKRLADEHQAFLQQRDAQEQQRKRWVEQGEREGLAALDARESQTFSPRLNRSVVETIPRNPER